MVANMGLPVRQPEQASSRGETPDHHQYAWLFKADASHTVIPSQDENSNSWEARAFAEDSNSLAAGIWPPRAYPCSFCRREFRSAQALGGHMNVHRRDRARLRHTSPPAPFRAAHSIPLQSSTNFHKSQHEYASSAIVNPSACPDIYPNKYLSKVNVLPTALSLPAVSIQSSSASLAASYPSDRSASFPLRLHLLASEAASTLMLPQAESLDLLSLWPSSALDSGNGCHSTISSSIKGSAVDISSWSLSSCSSSSASVVLSPTIGATPSRRARQNTPITQLEDESPKKKSNVTNNSDFQPSQAIKIKSSLEDDGISHAHDKQILDIDHVDKSICTQRANIEARSKFVDLELRLGQRPP